MDFDDRTHDVKLRDEIVESQRSQADLLKWKLIAVAAVAAVALGVGEKGELGEEARLLLCLVPLICAYVDLISLHLMVRIVTIGAYLEASGCAYERFAFAVRDRTSANPFVFEAVVLHGSSLVFDAGVVALAVVFHVTADAWSPWYTGAYLLAGLVGIAVTVLSWTVYTMRAREIRRAAEACVKGRSPSSDATAPRSPVAPE